MKKMAAFLTLIVCLILTTSCKTLSNVDTVAKDLNQKIRFVNEKIDKVKDYSEAQLVKLEKKANKAESDLAAVGIAIDADGDGLITPGEAKEAAKALAKGSLTDSDKRKLLFDPELWAGIIGLVGLSSGSVVFASKRRRTKAKIEELEAKAGQ